MEVYQVRRIKAKEAHPWILKKHYAHRVPSISGAFGLFSNKELRGICTFGKPVSNELCFGVCGDEYKDRVFELNRLVIEETMRNVGSFFVAKSLSYFMRVLPRIIVSYADTGQNHIGYIYQATNFIFTGTTALRTEMDPGNGRHSRHADDTTKRKIRTPKHRYVWFGGKKKQVKDMLSALKYPILPYPKGDTQRYDASAKVETQQLLF